MKSLVALALGGLAATVRTGIASIDPSNAIDVPCAGIIEDIEGFIHKEPHSDLKKHIMLRNLQDLNVDLYHTLILSNPYKYLPLIYTPTVGQACTSFSEITPKNSTGLYITPEDIDNIPTLFSHWSNPEEVKIIVITDGSRILGLGDLGSDGMGIPIGKSALYVSAGGFSPYEVVPITIDFGTDSDSRIADGSSYLGFPSRRMEETKVIAMVDKVVAGVKKVFPRAVLQWEDFSLNRAFELLTRHEKALPSFNDDIQGTAAVVLGGLFSATRLAASRGPPSAATVPDFSDIKLSDHTFLFSGSGSAALGVADLLVEAMIALEGLSGSDARERIWMTDSQGLVTLTRPGGVSGMKKLYARRDAPVMTDLKQIVSAVRPSVLVGLAGTGPIYTPEILRAVSQYTHRPIVFALSNPTSKAECSAQEAFDASNGRIIFAAGSPFPAPTVGPSTPDPEFAPPPQSSQCNNMFIFPGVGLGASVGRFPQIPNNMFLHAAVAMSRRVSPGWLSQGMLFPPLEELRDLSKDIASYLIQQAAQQALTPLASPGDRQEHVAAVARKLIEDAIWLPEEFARLPGSSVAHALEYVDSFMNADRSAAAHTSTHALDRNSAAYAVAPWKIRNPRATIAQSSATAAYTVSTDVQKAVSVVGVVLTGCFIAGIMALYVNHRKQVAAVQTDLAAPFQAY